MLDLPELLAPARRVNGLISMDRSRLMDLKPQTVICVIPSCALGGCVFFGTDFLLISDSLFKIASVYSTRLRTNTPNGGTASLTE